MSLSLKQTSRQLAEFFAELGWNATCCAPAMQASPAHTYQRRSRRSSARPRTLKD